jgi:hypothetical protein
LLDNLDDIEVIYRDLHTSTLTSIARHVKDTLEATGELGLMPSVISQIEQAQAVGILYDEIMAHVAKTLKVSRREIRKLFNDAAVESIRYDNTVYTQAGLKPININQSPAMLRILTAGANRQIGNLERLTGVFTAEASYKMNDVLDTIYRHENTMYMKTASGAFSYTEALRDAMDDLARDGVKVYHYDSGRAISLEAALLRDLRTGIAQTCGEITKQGMIECGATYVETSAHQGARNTGEGHKDHESWQGKVFHWKELEKERDLVK